MNARYQKAIMVAMEQEEKLDMFKDSSGDTGENEKRMLEDDLSFIREDFREQQHFMRDITELVSQFGPEFDTVNNPNLQEFFASIREISVNIVKELDEDTEMLLRGDDSEFDLKECITDNDDDMQYVKGPSADEESEDGAYD